MNKTIHSSKAIYNLPQPTPRRYFVKVFVVFACGLLIGFLFGQRMAEATSGDNCSDTQDNKKFASALKANRSNVKKRSRRTIKRPYLIKPEELYDVNDETAELQYKEEQADALIDQMFFRLSIFDRVPFPGQSADSAAEIAATSNVLYQQGLMDGVIRTAPELTEEMAARIDRTLCDPQAKTSQLISIARLIQITPELANEEGLDCIFAGRGDKEDIVLWSMLDAWNMTGLPKTDALSQIERTATDTRTQSRFFDREKAGYEPVEVEIDEVL